MKGLLFAERLKHATAGLVVAWHHERSFRSQIIIAVGTLSAGAAFRLPLIWWVALVFAIALVLVAEIINSSIEALADHLHPSQHPSIKIAKDMSAAAVLLASLAAAAIGVLLVLSVV
jgi:diacylglycerol kinase (ATP)